MIDATYELVVTPLGSVRAIYDETLDLGLLGQLRIRRGSHVEPDSAGRWIADLSPVEGPKLGPFKLRSQALAAERCWLRKNWI